MNTQFDPQEFIRKDQERQRCEDLLRRAFAAYYTHHPVWKEWGAIRSKESHPDSYYCGINQCKGVEYVVLGNMKGPLAVYRVAIRGQLQRVDLYSKDVLSDDRLSLTI